MAVRAHFKMLDLFQRYFSFRGIVFTNSKNVKQMASEFNITVMSNYQ